MLDLILVNLFRIIINFRKCKCAERLNKDGKSAREIKELLNEDESEDE